MQGRKFFMIIGLLIGLLTSCHQEMEGGRPKELVFAISVPEDNERYQNKVNAVTTFLSQKLGMKVKAVEVTNGTAVIEAIKANKIHLGYAGTYSYLLAHEKAGVIPIVTTANLEGQPYYHSCLVTFPGSGLNSLDDIKVKASETTLLWAYPSSTSGHLVPRYFLQQEGIYPADFKEVILASHHAASILNVASHKVDIAAIASNILEQHLAKGTIKAADIKIIWKSPPIIQGPVFVRKDLSEAFRKELQDAYLSMQEEAPELWEAYAAENALYIKYIPVRDKDFQEFRDMVNAIEDLRF